MQLKKDYIITLENDKKFLIVNDTVYGGVKYFLLMGITEDEKNITKDILIVEEYLKDGETFIKPVRNSELVIILTKILKPKE